MEGHRSRGLRLGLDHERERIDRIASGAVSLRPELQRRRVLIVEELRKHHERVELLLYALDEARVESAPHLRAMACRAWRDLRTRILDVVPARGRAAIRPTSPPPPDEADRPTMRCFEGRNLDRRRRFTLDGRPAGPDLV